MQFIPWNTKELWMEINGSVDHLCRIHHDRLNPVIKYAEQIHENLTFVFPEMDKLCIATCVNCRETCCSVAKLWYDFKDLVFLHVSGVSVPSAQPLPHYKEVCRYLSATGCTLPRICRPWICTHYICHAQTRYLRKYDRSLLEKINACLQEIKILRNQMEEEFIRVTT